MENFVFNVPETVNETRFFLYMNKVALNQTREADPALEAIKAVLRMVPETKFSKPKVDADVSILSPTLSGSAKDGGVINETAKVKMSTLELEFHTINILRNRV